MAALVLFLLLSFCTAWAAAYGAEWFLRRRHALPQAEPGEAAKLGCAWTGLTFLSSGCVSSVLMPGGPLPGWAGAALALALTHLAATGVAFALFGKLRADPAVPAWEVAAACAAATGAWLLTTAAAVAAFAAAG